MEINKIYQEPCLDTLKRMPSNYLDCVITSPPYYNARDYSIYPSYEAYLNFLEEVFLETYRISKKSLSVLITILFVFGITNCLKDFLINSISSFSLFIVLNPPFIVLITR